METTYLGKEIPKSLIQNNEGLNNENFEATIERLSKGNTYKDLSTIWITPTRGVLKPRIVTAWMSLMRPMNQPMYGPWFIEGDEVGIAYEKAFNFILESKEFSTWKYILTVEEDNLPPADGLLKLYESIEKGYDVVAGVYYTKAALNSEVYSQPMIYGDPKVMPRNFVPQIPQLDTLQPCNGLGMGFNLWNIQSLREKLKDLPKPWFKTVQEIGKVFSQDLWFYNEAAKYGFRVACDTRVKVGHLDVNTGIVW
jgi:hypothetical protein